MLLEIEKLGSSVLREVAKPISEVNDEIKKLAEDMFETMIEANGVGLAAPQIGKSIRMFVLIADDDVRRVFINPQIIKTSEEIGPYDEGCLSVPQVYETIERPLKVTVQALNENGKIFTLDADGLLARIIQHENDHLNGIIFIDRGDKKFAEKTEEQFKKRVERAEQKAKEKAAKQARIAAKIAAKEAKKKVREV